MRLLRALLLVLMIAPSAAAGAQQPAAPTAAASTTISVFLDCQNVFCDEDFMRTEIKAVNWVRDRAVSDVHILVTGEDTGAGGREFTCTFIGLRTFAGLTDTLKFSLPPAFTDHDRRDGMAKTFRAGLVRYVARTANKGQITVNLGGGAGATATQTSTKSDPWRAWVFRTGADGYLEGEEKQRFYGYNWRFNANRVTEQWKTQVSARQNNNGSLFKTSDTTEERTDQRRYGANILHVKSITPHWSVGVRGDFFSSRFENTTVQLRAMPAIEFSVFPYSQSTRRVFKFEYAVGMASQHYADTTIYDKVEETLTLQRLSTGIAIKQPWGSIDGSVVATQYLNLTNKYRISTFLGLSARPVKGFEVYTFGNYEIIYDQLSLQKGNYTPQQILLRQYQLGTKYRFWVNLGMSYTFGSIFNNVVNPRFD